ncbi:MAG: hypothetical protein B7Z45_10140 [Azorhizobium sp. 12-66-6]|nr:MAG: hypothetical protein B7Z45_10140 [Azorhizobium sp. 12-66-6]
MLTAFATRPPGEFDKPVRIQTKISTIPYMEVDKVCSWPMRSEEAMGGRIEGCARVYNAVCYVVLSAIDGVFMTRGKYARLLKHELAHCNGWPSHHPGAQR